LRRSAVAQHFDAADRMAWNAGEIGRLCAARAEQRRAMVSLAVDEHERLVGRKPAQAGGADEGLPVCGRQALDVERGQQLRQRIVQVARHARFQHRV
jgi:hypothetical protein